MSVLDNLSRIIARIHAAAERVQRDASTVEIVAVTKNAEVEQIQTLLTSGKISALGESKVQDAEKRREKLEILPGYKSGAVWRMIGHLQTNKAQKALEFFDSVDALESLELARALDRRLDQMGRTLPVLVQVKLTDREAQSGVAPEHLEEFLSGLKVFRRLQVRGLMAIAPMLEPAEKIRPYFRRVRELADRFMPEWMDGGTQKIVSMGMSRDFEVAVEEGATMVRLGTALFARNEDSQRRGQQHDRQGTSHP